MGGNIFDMKVMPPEVTFYLPTEIIISTVRNTKWGISYAKNTFETLVVTKFCIRSQHIDRRNTEILISVFGDFYFLVGDVT
jgi:hypothetical protein